MIDFQSTVDDSWLEKYDVEKGCRKLITVEERTELLQRLDDESYQISAGGSLSNTLMALSRLANARSLSTQPSPSSIHVAMAGLIGTDTLGSFYSAQMRSSGVSILSPPTPDTHTGTVVVLSTQDAQRTMLSYLGTPAPIIIDNPLHQAISQSRMLLIEGYLWELPGAMQTIKDAIAAAQRHGTLVAMTAGDAGVVHRHHREIWECIGSGIDILFTNAQEAQALMQYCPDATGATNVKEEAADLSMASASSGAEAAALSLGSCCNLVCVTDGSAGSVITALGQLYTVPPCWMESPPLDTCGAGDAWAAGFLHAFMEGYDVVTMGRCASRTATAVISQQGAALSEEGAAACVKKMPVRGKSALAMMDVLGNDGSLQRLQ